MSEIVHPAKREKILRDAYAREGRRCFWCKTRMRLHWRGRAEGGAAPDDGATLDHIVPVSRGGRLTLENVVCACWQCNRKRGAMKAERFLAVAVSAHP